ncbi:uncharacterized protein Z518_11169 [Rhinocladiella mackenziei CBS 650.93]|uniref:Cyclin-dependent protein kinase regulator Pho80 n=1 Tax=Rhinocladiella mackenziei CBS 650.93 TaxID=1442369 RepID=A0A0D2I863_9EURO|nr:uncharacterized protein Z518_11169 [Rhinocladiella mackenziei CBS 650.93]KIW99430.1 hypothetical protein Z518_11169 [Rhinocladiella mackenziei CBS 650.93]
MLATSPSPKFATGGTFSQYDRPAKQTASPALKQNEPARKYYFSPDISFRRPHRNTSTRSLDRYPPPVSTRVKMVDAGTQTDQKVSPDSSTKTPTSTIARLQLSEREDPTPKTAHPASSTTRRPSVSRSAEPANVAKAESIPVPIQAKRQAVEPPEEPVPTTNGVASQEEASLHQSPVKKARPDAPPVRLMPVLYENCNTRDLVVLISSMLMELIRYNDAIPLREGQLTRFHSRAPPGISVLDYLQRLTTHATLSPPILLSVVYYIDRLCALYPAFTISSLTVHRFLITSATVASKGLSDSFWTNKTYARVGGVSMKELALLELEFLTRMEWRIVPKPEVLCDYYKSLIERNSQYQLEG